MELNREQIIKALECCGELIRNALALINELIEEADRHKKRADRHFENLKSVLDERSDIEADTVRKMQERLKEKMNNLSRMKYHFKSYFLVSKSFIDQIAKEMLEEGKQNDN